MLTRQKFEELNNDLFVSTIETVEQALKKANLKVQKIHEVALVEGSSNIPKIQNLLKTLFSENNMTVSKNANVAGKYK